MDTKKGDSLSRLSPCGAEGGRGFPSGFEGVVGFAVVGEVAEVVYGVFEQRGGGEDRQADGGAGQGTSNGEGEASGFAKEGEDVEEFGGHTPGAACQLAEDGRSESVFRGGLGVAVAEFAADAEAEVNEGREADRQADVGVEAFEGGEGEKAYRAVVRDWVAEDGESGGEHGGGRTGGGGGSRGS